MENLLIYFIKVQVVFSLFFLVYLILFKKEKFLQLNRFLLLFMVGSAFLLPLLPTLYQRTGAIVQGKESLILLPFPQTVNIEAHPVMINQTIVAPINYRLWLISAYIFGSVFLLLGTGFQYFKLYQLIKTSSKQRNGAFVFCEPALESQPFSFFNYIVISRKNLGPQAFEQIKIHECVHSKQWHSLDLLLSEIAGIFLWINPLVIVFKRQLKLNLEFLADEETLAFGVEAKSYQLNLLANVKIRDVQLPVNTFFSSKLKERILMINTPKPKSKRAYKYLAILPAILMFNLLVGFEQAKPLDLGLVKTETPPSTQSTNLAKINSFKKIRLPSKSPKPRKNQFLKPVEENLPRIYVDARTDTVKFRLVADLTEKIEHFKGIYVVENQIFTEKELRSALQKNSKLDFILPKTPVIGFYGPKHEKAMQEWGEIAKDGVIYVQTKN